MKIYTNVVSIWDAKNSVIALMIQNLNIIFMMEILLCVVAVEMTAAVEVRQRKQYKSQIRGKDNNRIYVADLVKLKNYF